MIQKFKYYKKIKDKLFFNYGKVKFDVKKNNINKLLNKKKSHYLSIYKDYLLYDCQDEFIKKNYHLRESLDKLVDLAKYYKNYLSFFCRPFCLNTYCNKIIEDYYDKKAEFFYNENFGNVKKKKQKNKKNNNNILIFNEIVRKSIENPTQSTLNLNSINSDLNTQRLIEEDFLTSKTQKEGLDKVIKTLDKKYVEIKDNYETIINNNETPIRHSIKGLFTIYKSNQNTHNIHFHLGKRENSSNFEKTKICQYKKLKPYISNYNLRSKKNFSTLNQDNSMKHSMKLSNKNINISTKFLDYKKKGFINYKENNMKSLSNGSKHITYNLLSTYMNNCFEKNKYKFIHKKELSSNSFKDSLFKNSIDSKTINNRKYIKLKGNNLIQPLNINYIQHISKLDNSKKNSVSNKSFENINKKIKYNEKNNNENNKNKNKFQLNVNSELGKININNLGSLSNSNSLSNIFKQSINQNIEQLKNNEKNIILDKIIENSKIQIKYKRKLNFHSPNHYLNMNHLKNIFGNEIFKKKINSKLTNKNIFSCREEIPKKKTLIFSPIDSKN